MSFLAAMGRGTGARPVAPTRQGPAFHSASGMHVGRVRAINEDRLLDRADAGLWAVADGMGGHHGGDLAATTVIAALDRCATAGPSPNAIAKALASANREILAMGGEGETSGCTIVGMAAEQGRLHLFWAGDSRAYRWRDGVLDLLSHDHSLVQQLVDAEALTPAQAVGHPQSHVITRALGTSDSVEIDTLAVEVRPGDRFLLCSDGLWGMVVHDAIARHMAEPLATAISGLTRAALDGGGKDNLAMVAIRAD